MHNNASKFQYNNQTIILILSDNYNLVTFVRYADTLIGGRLSRCCY